MSHEENLRKEVWPGLESSGGVQVGTLGGGSCRTWGLLDEAERKELFQCRGVALASRVVVCITGWRVAPPIPIVE